jgi:hypothetical protein
MDKLERAGIDFRFAKVEYDHEGRDMGRGTERERETPRETHF